MPGSPGASAQAHGFYITQKVHIKANGPQNWRTANDHMQIGGERTADRMGVSASSVGIHRRRDAEMESGMNPAMRAV